MMLDNQFQKIIDQLNNRTNPGVGFLILGCLMLIFSGVFQPQSPISNIIIGLIAAISVIFIFTGTVLTVTRFRVDLNYEPLATNTVNVNELENTYIQLTRNYDILRNQTVQGLVIAVICMFIGIAAIFIASVGQAFGLPIEGSNLAAVGGVFSEFISVTSLLVYWRNFNRLKETSDDLNKTWKMLTALKNAASLPDESKARFTEELIRQLAGLSHTISMS